jgi:hypothetical protein
LAVVVDKGSAGKGPVAGRGSGKGRVTGRTAGKDRVLGIEVVEREMKEHHRKGSLVAGTVAVAEGSAEHISHVPDHRTQPDLGRVCGQHEDETAVALATVHWAGTSLGILSLDHRYLHDASSCLETPLALAVELTIDERASYSLS